MCNAIFLNNTKKTQNWNRIDKQQLYLKKIKVNMFAT